MSKLWFTHQFLKFLNSYDPKRCCIMLQYKGVHKTFPKNVNFKSFEVFLKMFTSMKNIGYIVWKNVLGTPYSFQMLSTIFIIHKEYCYTN
jgi:hypothetical protein